MSDKAVGSGRVIWIALGSALAVLLPLLPALASNGYWHPWHESVSGGFREASYLAGELIYTNGVGQGRGPNTDRVDRDQYLAPIKPVSQDGYGLGTCDLFGVHRLLHSGDFVLPTDHSRWPDFTGELAELRMAVEGRSLFLRLRFASFPSPTAQIATVTFTPAGTYPTPLPWPANAGVKGPFAVALTVTGTGTVVSTSTRSQDLVRLGGDTRVTDHAFEARVPLSLLPRGRWQLGGGSGLADPSDPRKYWTVLPGDATAITPGNLGLPVGTGLSTPAPNVWSLLFADDDPWAFDEHTQANLLAGTDVTQASLTIDPALLISHATVPAPLRHGAQSRLFSSSLDRGDGITRTWVDLTDPSQTNGAELPRPPDQLAVGVPDVGRMLDYTGRLQQYGLFVPTGYAPGRASPLIIYLHGLNGEPCEPFVELPGLQKQLDQRGYLLAAPLGRGDHWYHDTGELDVLEVIKDVERHYDVDRDRVFVMGHSMGGAGTYNVVLRHPDLFAGAVPVEGVDSAELWGNGQNVPWFHIGAAFDADVDAQKGKDFYAERSARGWDSRLLEYHSKTHEYSTIYDTLPQIFDFFDSHRRVTRPAHVSFTIPADAQPGLGLADSSAYWVTSIARQGSGPTSVAATSFAIRHRDIDASRSARIDLEQTDQGGGVGQDTSAVYLQTTPAYGPYLPTSNSVQLSLTGVRAITLDSARMGLDPRLPVTLRVSSDHQTSISLAGRATITVAAGSHQVEVATT